LSAANARQSCHWIDVTGFCAIDFLEAIGQKRGSASKEIEKWIYLLCACYGSKGTRQASEFYKSIGQTSLKIVSLEETEISNHYSLVTVRWLATFRKTGDKLVEFDDSYVVHRIGREPKIVVLIVHQDERKALKELGLAHN